MRKTSRTRDYYLYVYCDPRKKCRLKVDGHLFKHVPIYIGYGRKNRMLWHLRFYKTDTNMLKINKIKAIQRSNLDPIIYKIREGLTCKKAQDLEKQFIKAIGTITELPNIKRGSLTNLTTGGDGGPTFYGRKLTEEHKRKISEGNKGRVFTDETRKRQSISQKKRNIKISDDKRKKMVKGLKNMSEESRNNISKATKNTVWIYNVETKRNKRVKKGEVTCFVKKGWKVGFYDKRQVAEEAPDWSA